MWYLVTSVAVLVIVSMLWKGLQGIPIATLFSEWAADWSGSATLFNDGTAHKLRLSMSDWTPSGSTVIGDVTPATFDGSAAISLGVDSFASAIDPLTQEILLVADTAQSLIFTVTGPTNLPQTIYGWYITNTGGTVYKIGGKFATPIELNATAQIIEVPHEILRVKNGCVS